MSSGPFVLEVDASPPCLEQVHALLATVWELAPDVSEEARTRFAITTAELVANVVEHGGGCGTAPPWLKLEVQPLGDGAVCGRLADDGDELPEGAIADPAAPEGVEIPDLDDIDLMAESGRGLPLVRAAADEFHYERIGSRNEWRFTVRRR